MTIWKKCTVIGLIVCLVQLSAADLVTARGTRSSDDPAKVKEKVEVLGVKSKVEVNVKGGDRLLGTIQSIGEDGFELATSGGPSRHISYDQVRSINLTKPTYRASGQPDPVEARRAVVSWGAGKAIRVSLADGRKLKGKIQTIDAEHFTLTPNSQAEPVEIAFTEVQQVEPGGMTSRTGWLILGAAAGGLIIVGAILASAMSG